MRMCGGERGCKGTAEVADVSADGGKREWRGSEGL